MRVATLCFALFAVAFASKLNLNATVDPTRSFTCEMFTDVYGDLYNINGLANGGEGHYVQGMEAGKYYRLSFCEVFTSRYKHNECSNISSGCFVEKIGDGQFKGYEIGDARTMRIESFGTRPLIQEDGISISMEGQDIPPGCTQKASVRVDLTCDRAAVFPVIEFLERTATCEYLFGGYAAEACSLNRCPTFSTVYGTIDLNPLNTGDAAFIPAGAIPGSPENALSVTMCGSHQPGQSNCTTQGISVCEQWPGPVTHRNWKDVASAIGWTVTPIGDSSQPAGVVLSTGYGEYSNTCEHANRAEFTVNCATGVTGTPVMKFDNKGTEEATDCVYRFSTEHDSACIVSAHPSPGVVIGDTWLSVGSVMTIMFFVGGTVYLGIGMGFNYFVGGKRGVEMVPNLGFWGALPGLVSDGVSFTFSKCPCGKGGGSSNLYDTV